MSRPIGSINKKVTRGNGRWRLWQTARLFRKNGATWTVKELAVLSDVKPSYAHRYVKSMLTFGYLRIARPHRHGKRCDGDALYMLCKDTGPNPPKLTVNGDFYDPNTDETLQAEDINV